MSTLNSARLLSIIAIGLPLVLGCGSAVQPLPSETHILPPIGGELRTQPGWVDALVEQVDPASLQIAYMRRLIAHLVARLMALQVPPPTATPVSPVLPAVRTVSFNGMANYCDMSAKQLAAYVSVTNTTPGTIFVTIVANLTYGTGTSGSTVGNEAGGKVRQEVTSGKSVMVTLQNLKAAVGCRGLARAYGLITVEGAPTGIVAAGLLSVRLPDASGKSEMVNVPFPIGGGGAI